jgi:hypothetical protein
MKTTHFDRGEWTETIFEPDDESTGDGKANGHAKAEAKPKAEAKIDAGVIAWPVLDKAAYHGLVGQVVETILPHTESDPVALLLQYLVSFGNAIGRQPYYLVEGTEHYAILYALLAGTTAKARKGTSAQRIRPVFRIVDPDWANNNVASGISSGEGILHAIRDPIYGVRKGEQVLLDAGVIDKRLMLDEREFSSALDSMKREGNVVSRIVRDAWDSPLMLRTLTKQNPTKVTRPHISIIGHITIDELQKKLDQNSMANGFANRFLYSCIRRSKMLPRGGTLVQENIEELGAATLKAVTATRTITHVTMTPAAIEMWDGIYTKLNAEVPGLLGAITARGDAQTVRLALLYALLDQAQQIDTVHLEAALAVWDFCEASARYIFGDLTGDPLADTILRMLRNAAATGMDRTDISNQLGRNTPADKIAAALGRLLAVGKVRFNKLKPNGPGRTREVWLVV